MIFGIWKLLFHSFICCFCFVWLVIFLYLDRFWDVPGPLKTFLPFYCLCSATFLNKWLILVIYMIDIWDGLSDRTLGSFMRSSRWPILKLTGGSLTLRWVPCSVWLCGLVASRVMTGGRQAGEAWAAFQANSLWGHRTSFRLGGFKSSDWWII